MKVSDALWTAAPYAFAVGLLMLSGAPVWVAIPMVAAFVAVVLFLIWGALLHDDASK